MMRRLQGASLYAPAAQPRLYKHATMTDMICTAFCLGRWTRSCSPGQQRKITGGKCRADITSWPSFHSSSNHSGDDMTCAIYYNCCLYPTKEFGHISCLLWNLDRWISIQHGSGQGMLRSKARYRVVDIIVFISYHGRLHTFNCLHDCSLARVICCDSC